MLGWSLERSREMKLIDLLKAMAVNNNFNVTLVDADDKAMITFEISGYENLESDLSDREVKKIKITSSSTATIVIGEVVTP